MAKIIDHTLLRRYRDDAKQCDTERDRQYKLYTQFAWQIDTLLSGDSISMTAELGRYNLIKTQINQICNPILDQPPEITVYPGDGAHKSMATALSGTIRHIQYECSAAATYAAAMRQMVAGGLGSWLCVLDDDDEAQGLQPAIEQITDPTSVHFDPTSRRPDRRDARYVTRDYMMALEDFQEQYPKAMAPQPPEGIQQHSGTSEMVQLTELYVRVRRDGAKAINRYVITDLEILETDETYPIPYLPVYLMQAPTCEIDGKYVMMPLTFDLVDVQRELAYWKSQTAKLIGRAPKSTWMADKGTIDPADQKDYADAALDDEAKAILFYDSKNGTAQKPTPIAPPELPSSYLQLIQHNLAFARDITGIYPDQGQMQQQGRDPASGTAIKQQRSISAIASAHFTSQLNYQMRLTGDWMVAAAQIILNDGRTRISMQGDRTTQLVSYGGAPVEGVANYDLSQARFGVVVGASPNYASQKQELLQTLGDMAAKNPKVFELTADYIVAQWPLPGTEDLQERLQAGLLPPNVQQLIASKANSDPAARAQQMQLQLQTLSQTKDQLQQALQTVSQQLQEISTEYSQLKDDKTLEREHAAAKLQLDQQRLEIDRLKLDLERMRIESTERVAIYRVDTDAAAKDASNDVQVRTSTNRDATSVQVAEIRAGTELDKQERQHAHETDLTMLDALFDASEPTTTTTSEEYHG